MPLDEDALTVADLFELASRVLEILYPFPTSLRFDPVEPVESGAEDARNLLRGILHGCDVLEPYLDQRRAEMEQDKLDALGLGEAAVAAVHVRYLQAFALRHLGELFQPAPPTAVVAGSKRRKIDLLEPQSASEWFEAAEERLSGEMRASDSILAVLLAAERAHLFAVVSASPDSLPELEERLAGVIASLGSLEPESTSPTSADVSDAWYAALRALTAGVVALEGIRDPEALCSVTASSVDVPLCLSFGVGAEPPSTVLLWLREVLRADVQLARFGIAEDWIEERYRADADDEDEDGEVAALPDEAQPFVEVVQEYGRQGAFAGVFVFLRVVSNS